MPAQPMNNCHFLFGGDKPWNPSQWTDVDDRVRGGASQSYLSVPDSRDVGVFHGNLDIKTLGGAGFASQKTVFDSASDLSGYDGLEVVIAAGNDKVYTLILKDGEDLPKRPDGRLQSTVSWEFDFSLKKGEDGVAGAKDRKVVDIPWKEFKPTYRGRPKEDAEPLDLKKLRSLSIMMRSHFGEQEGEINLSIRSIAAFRGKNELARSASASTVDSLDKGRLDEKQDGRVAGSRSTSWFSCLAGILGGRR